MQEFFDLSHRSTRKGKYSAIAGVVLTLGALIAEVVYIVFAAGKDSPNVKDYASAWDEEYLAKTITFRNKILDSQIAAIMCFCIALGLMLHSIFTVKKLYRNDKTWFKNGLLFSFAFALVLAIIQTLQYLGASVGARSLSLSRGLPYEGLVAIEVAWTLSVSMGTFLLGGQTLGISFGIICCFVLTYRAGGDPKYRLTIRHSIFGLFVALIGILAFIFQMVQALDFGTRFNSVTGVITGILTILFSYVLFPAWLVWLGVQLGTREFPDMSERANLMNERL